MTTAAGLMLVVIVIIPVLSQTGREVTRELKTTADLKLGPVPTRSPLPSAALFYMSRIPSAPFTDGRAGAVAVLRERRASIHSAVGDRCYRRQCYLSGIGFAA